MRFFAAIALCACIVLPVFSQNAAGDRVNALSDSMNNTVTRSNAKLANFDSMIKDDGSIKMYTTYKRKYEALNQALQRSESQLNLLLRTNDRMVYIKEERDNYEDLVNQLQTMKSEFDSWMRSQ